MVFSVAVDLPEVVELGVGENIFDTQHRRHHGVVLIVIFVHAVATDEVQVWITCLQFLTNRGDVPCVIVIVNRVRFLLPNNAAIDEVALLGQSDLNELASGEFN